MRAKRVVTIHVQDDREKEELLREIERLNLPVFIYVHGKLNDLKINVQGTKGDIRDAVRKIHEIHSRVKAKLYADGGGMYRGSIDDLMREARTGVPTPVLVKTLELLGEHVEVKEGELRTSVSWSDLVALTRKLGETLSEISLQTTRQIREVVLPVSVAYNIPPEDVIRTLVELNAAEWKEDKFKYELIKNKEQALEMLLKHIKGEKNED